MNIANGEFDLSIQEFGRFLEVSEGAEIVYDPAADLVEVFKYDYEKKIIFSGTLSDSVRLLEASGTENSKKQIESLYNALKSGKESFSENIDLHKGRYLVRYKVYKNEGNKVYGVFIPLLKGGFIPAYRRSSDKDAMLDMLNKRAINEYAHKVCAQDDCPTTYIIMFDLDNFKVVNDSFGHVFGDEVLHTVTSIINKAIGDHGMVGRVGGDEIMIVTKGIGDKTELRPYMREIRVNVEEQFKDKLNGISLTCSMGAAAYPDHGDSCDKVLDIADKMLYLAKEKGRNRYIIYTPDMHSQLIKAPEKSEAGLKTVLANNFDKVSIIHYMMEDYLKNGTSSNAIAFGNVGNAFNLQEILIVYENAKVGFRWSVDNSVLSEADLKWMELNDEFYSQFNKDGMFIVDGLYDLVGEKERYKEKIVERGAESVLFYRLKKDDDYQGFVLFVKKGQRQKWSEYELLALSTIGKIFELSVQGQ